MEDWDSTTVLVPDTDGTVTTATGLVGATTGALAGAIAGPFGAIVGAVLGAITGALAGSALEDEGKARAHRNAILDAEIGIIGGDIGIRK